MHGEGEVKVSSDYEPIEIKKQGRGLPPIMSYHDGEKTGGEENLKLAGNRAQLWPG
jgi:hypothetical protein